MRNRTSWLLIAGFVGMVAPLSAQLPQASVVEVRNAQGQVVLRGQFDTFDDDERYAALGPADLNLEGTGEIEVDARQMEGELRHLAPRATFTIAIDGRDVGTVTTDSDGDADFDVGS